MNSYEYQEAILASNLTANAKLTALAISYHYNWKKAMASFPSIATLVQRTSLSRATIYRAKNELIDAGFLNSTRRFNDSNLYLPVIPAQSQTDTLGVSEGRTNNEYNNELNNEKIKESDFQSSSLSNINNVNQEKVINDFDIIFNMMEGNSLVTRKESAPHPAGNSSVSNKFSGRDDIGNAEVSSFNQELARARGEDW